MKKLKLIIPFIGLCFMWNVNAAPMPPTTQWVFSRANACLNPDNVTHTAANGECLALQTYTGKTNPIHPILLVFIHGDGIPGGGPSDYLKYQATKFVNDKVVSVVLIRPGYYDSYNNYSTGESHAFDCNGYPCDGYRPNTVETIADAVKNLKQYYGAQCTILIGHSGGAMMSAVILGKYPQLANGAVLASMVGNVHQWAKRHGWGDWPNSLSPNDFINTIPKKDFVYIISGKNDINTYPDMTKQYAEQLQKQGINVHLISVPGGDHNSVVLDNPTAFDNAIHDAITQCPHN